MSKKNLESLSSDMFAPLSEQEASLVVGGASEIVGVSGIPGTTYWSDGGVSRDLLVTDVLVAETIDRPDTQLA